MMEKLELSPEYEKIKEIPDYGFSGREDLEEITLPASVKKIGRYAFYNCRNLRKIIFFSGIQDVGSGAFTGCHKVRHLDVTIMQENESCLKDFLQELTEEMLVEYRGEEYARLMLPEYFEEGVENTPARILMTQYHGSGLKYRNCFSKNEIQFDEYDARFSDAKATESSEFLQKLVVGRLRYPYRLHRNGREQYERYLKENLVVIGEKMIQSKDTDALAWLIEYYGRKQENLEALLEYCGRMGAAECTSILMEWKRRRFAKKISLGMPDFEL
ncbi:MAG: leucine-rich repeat domain-containing protein [Clostridia bacterium]|nr:leucine-rich repeat domain-containing protein [Clostridia bacterium]NCC43061.1 leucine-rich repeat domain-containing protein [Clostridia bacterium]